MYKVYNYGCYKEKRNESILIYFFKPSTVSTSNSKRFWIIILLFQKSSYWLSVELFKYIVYDLGSKFILISIKILFNGKNIASFA